MNKFNIFLVIVSFIGFTGSAQELQSLSEVEQHKYEMRVYSGYGSLYSDVPTNKNYMVYGADFGYAVLPYLNVHFDIQTGKYKGGDRMSERQHYMEFTNQFVSTNVIGKFFPLRLVADSRDPENPTALKHFQGFYIATGIGLHFNNVKAYNTSDPNVGYLNNNSDMNMYIPAEVGFSYPIVHFGKLPGSAEAKSSLYINVGYRYNFNFSDSWDGYNPTVSSNEHNDASSAFLFGLGLTF